MSPPRTAVSTAIPKQREHRVGYCRERDLARLLGLWPEEVAATGWQDQFKLLQRLAAVLRRERQRGRSGHFAYDLARHHTLLRAYEAERALFSEVEAGAWRSHRVPRHGMLNDLAAPQISAPA